MSAWYVASGGIWIATGAATMWQDRRLLRALVTPPYRAGEVSRSKRKQRRKALADLRFSLWFVVSGVAWVTRLVSYPVIAWIACGYLVVLLTFDLSAWARARRRRKTAEQLTPLADGTPPLNRG
jgi:hypothetical protein